MFLTTLVLLLMGVQGVLGGETLSPAALIPCAAVLVMGWGLYIFSVGIQHRVSFEIETVGILLSGIGINLLASFDLEGVTTPAGRHAFGDLPVLLPPVVYGGHGPGGQVPAVDRPGGPGAAGGHPGLRHQHLRLHQLDPHRAPFGAAL